MSYLTKGLKTFLSKGFKGIEEELDKLQPNLALALFTKQTDLYYNKFDRLPPQAFWKPERGEAVIKGLKKGMTKSAAVAKSRVPEKIVKQWLQMGEQGLEPFATFYLDFQEALALQEEAALDEIHDESGIEWGKFVLLNGEPKKRWGQPSKATVSLHNQNNVLQLGSSQSDSAKNEILKQLISKMSTDKDIIEGDYTVDD